ncbi:hypothetical protein P280DRAFT_474217 [Massarina eburnea CBS 473.64]|uniref:Ada DNA repair metal-binding domain-containing protein n=1 Tax=Massarina eburnea CBS 473.64 TaxID=1395130 RepID=A0A6A6RLK0_9PLEO|nr:hypothetical protein P280DRAFT_474217 [Massarina eburnea CBS 473.64]
MSFTTDAARWRALSMHDPTANNHFVYTVKSTLIYCRPTCPARLARRANIGFCNTPAQAEAAGYRACKRCQPNIKASQNPQEKAVAKACTLIEETLLEWEGKGKHNPRLHLAKSVGLTPRYFHKIFKDKMRVTPKEYAKAKMGEKSAGPTTVPQDAAADVDLFDLDDFDFNDLINFDLDETLPVGVPFTLPVMPPLPGIQLPAALGTFDPESVSAGPADIDKLSKWLASDKAPVETTASFELDTALVLSSEMIPNGEGVYMNLFV